MSELQERIEEVVEEAVEELVEDIVDELSERPVEDNEDPPEVSDDLGPLDFRNPKDIAKFYERKKRNVQKD